MEEFDLSVVIPVFNSSITLEPVLQELHNFLNTCNFSSELILVNDSSTDSSYEVIRKFSQENINCKSINLFKRQGQHRAVLAGLHYARGEFVVVMDDDGQNPPSEILTLLATARDGCDLVFGNYSEYKQKFLRRVASSLMKVFVRFIFDSPRGVLVSNFKIIHRKVVRQICLFAKTSTYINGEALLYATNPKSIVVDHRISFVGKSRYNLFKLLSIFKNVLFAYSLKPLRALITLTFSVSFVGVFTSLVLLIIQYSNQERIQGWTSLTLIITFLSTLIISSIALISEYIVQTLESNSRKSVLDYVETD